jgi:hypothetical protein
MSITWEQARILERHHQLPKDELPDVIQVMRSAGVRRENAFKSILFHNVEEGREKGEEEEREKGEEEESGERREERGGRRVEVLVSVERGGEMMMEERRKERKAYSLSRGVVPF